MINTYYELHKDFLIDDIQNQILVLRQALYSLDRKDTTQQLLSQRPFRLQKVQGNLKYLRNRLEQQKVNKA